MEQIRDYIEPIKRKWIYHFVLSTKTNIIEKPEWYLNQTLKWIQEHIDIVADKLSTSKNYRRSQVKNDFVSCMIELPMIRLNRDMTWLKERVIDDPKSDILLIHTYNEVIQFTKVIHELLGDKFYELDEKHDLLAIFSDQVLFEKIIDIEWEYADKNLKEITNCDNKWEPILEGEFVDSYKIPRCVDRLLLLIKAITERVECIKQPDCQFQLIELQCSLFKKFLAFLKKSTDVTPVHKNILSDILFLNDDSTIDLSKILRVLNGVNFLRLILRDQYFIPKSLINNLDESLSETSKKLAADYKNEFYKLVDRVVAIYKDIDCDHNKFLEFIRPKLAHNAYGIVDDETSKIYQRRQTAQLLKNL